MAFNRRRRRGGSQWFGSFLALVVLGGLGWGGYLAGDWLVHHNTEFRRWYNVSRAEPYRYEGTRPIHTLTDPASLVSELTSETDIAARRRALSQAIFGSPSAPFWTRPETVERSISLEDVPALAPYRQLTVLMRVDRLTIPVDVGFTSIAYHLRPVDPRGMLVVWQQGFAATVADAAPLLVPLLERGYDVMALNNVGAYGENQLKDMDLPRYGHVSSQGRLFLSVLPYPLRRFLFPPLVAANYALEELGLDHYAMAGIAAGGWATVVQAALDQRILRSYPMAGAYPLTFQQEDDHPPPAEQYYPTLVQAASYAEMYVMGAHGEGRGQIQFFGQYDRCCQNNRVAELYAQAITDKVSALGPGSFEIHINDTSPDHVINPDYVTRVLDDLITLE
ncbi:MAG: alpha/beta hydrolase [Rhodospirillum sp.]|nr:alpha/beta hydrolase [Rhodospirillum sp.]MCF8488651.1 alpha/beta hydrolase [Rhodospirillum sp.]MCF8501744.1 alpha/beta hydrolase [Rhodospirillum sp.]